MSVGNFAVFSDVHSNLEAFEAVLGDMAERGVTPVACLGDTVGYGPSPRECLLKSQQLQQEGCILLRGNHDEAVARPARLRQMNEVARNGAQHSIEKLTAAQIEFLSELPLSESIADCTFVHASLHEPGRWHYILDEEDLLDHFEAQTTRAAFCGHTHTPMVYLFNEKDDEINIVEGVGRVRIPASAKFLVNVGSVGQPRDLSPDACYVVCDKAMRTIEFRRVPYDVARTRRKVARANLHEFIGLRLLLGI